jgi:hypothetical protein
MAHVRLGPNDAGPIDVNLLQASNSGPLVLTSQKHRSGVMRVTQHISFMSLLVYTFIILIIVTGLRRVYDPLSTVSFLSDTSEKPLCPLSSFLLRGGYRCSLPWAPALVH